MTTPTFTMRRLVESGVHFGHSTRRWNPKMAPYIYGERSGIHIIDLRQTMPMLYRAMEAVREVAAGGGRVLFVGTKRQASQKVAEAADRCGQYFVNHRWLGGMMTNWSTISNSIKRLKDLESRLAEEQVGLTKKELLGLTRERDKLHRALGGIKDMGGLPDILLVIDTNKESIAVAEANKLKIPVVGILDTNSDPDGIDFPVPGNDDAVRAIDLYCELVSGAVLTGIQEEIARTGGDLGEAEDAPTEDASAKETPAEKSPAKDTPAEDTPTEDASAKETPAEKSPAKETPAKETPAKDTPAKDAPAEDTSAKETPAEKSPAKETPAKDTPAEDAPTEDASAKETPAEKSPAKDTPAEDAPTEDASAKETPAKDMPAEDASAKETPAEKSPAKETPAEKRPAKETPAEDTPAKDTPAKDTPAEDAPTETTETEEKTPVEKDASATTS